MNNYAQKSLQHLEEKEDSFDDLIYQTVNKLFYRPLTQLPNSKGNQLTVKIIKMKKKKKMKKKIKFIKFPINLFIQNLKNRNIISFFLMKYLKY